VHPTSLSDCRPIEEYALIFGPAAGTVSGMSNNQAALSASRDRALPGARSINRTIRVLMSCFGVITLGMLAVTMWTRGVDRVEVLAAALYVLVFAGVLAADVIGGAAAALLAAAIYMVLRLPALEVLGTGKFATLNLIRLLSYLAFGVIGGVAWKLLQERLDKLESFDTVDDITHLLNARGLSDLLDHEMARGRRYENTFSVVTVSFPSETFLTLNNRQRRRAFAQFGDAARNSVRTTDRLGLVRDNRKITLVVFCPETDKPGAQIVLGRLGDSVRDTLLPIGVGLGRRLDEFIFMFPQESVELSAFKDDLVERTRQAFPDARSEVRPETRPNL
jgi:GGDEF domain-containing protein